MDYKIEFSDKEITPNGGLVLLKKMNYEELIRFKNLIIYLRNNYINGFSSIPLLNKNFFYYKDSLTYGLFNDRGPRMLIVDENGELINNKKTFEKILILDRKRNIYLVAFQDYFYN
ncbi:MAG: hypothetical protein A2X61_11425 [Ignavibacteria bacterium GWB2_35_12]|nr:MAG: hypothetical protein A2X61_11425 [Ignavibacteria bacterium GWB2_35_12]OGU86331.1 MAG: hypothetical protein A2220_15225 [Ignavibacteria bacterium RIFOXYA2_FULL_35_10]OGV20097.1 MAG: hypothetical protein A2475_05800 [Ignavibacteria bacterium RIFOXYC2_FULL_35_21]